MSHIIDGRSSSHYACLSAGLVALTGVAAASLGATLWQLLSPIRCGVLGLSFDRITTLLALLVSVVGCVTFRFSMTFLDGDPRRVAFLGYMAATVLSACLLMLADNLVLLWLAWFLTSVGLHKLLTFYRDRPQALAPARKKFLISRLGDVTMIWAFALIWMQWDTLSLNDFLARSATESRGGTAAWVAVLLAVAALTKSAQFPFHSWLPETMESPTPVSALMHAGIINAGGALLLKFMPLLLASPAASTLLVCVGTVTICLGMVCTWAQVKVKRTLAWSTVAQMGFMMMQCGLGAPAAALLHLIGHGFYKAYSFLRSGELPPSRRGAPPTSATHTLTQLGLGLAVSAPALWAAGRWTDFKWHRPAEAALGCIFALALAQIWVTPTSPAQPRSRQFGTRLLLTVGASVSGLAIYRAVEAYLAAMFPVDGLPVASTQWLLAAVPVFAMAGLCIFHAFLPTIVRHQSGRSLYVHALHGFYVGAIADQLVASVWPAPKRGNEP